MTNLRVLMIDGTCCSVDLPNKLRLLIWPEYPSKCMPSTFQPKLLVELRLSFSSIEQLWDTKVDLPKLIYLDLSYSMSLTKCPDLTGFLNLECLLFESCTALLNLHSSIKILEKLKNLSMKDCKNLCSLPYGIESQSLTDLVFSGCLKLNNISENFGDLKKLTHLDLHETPITELPKSIGNFINLDHLDLSGCARLESLPSSIGLLKNLKKLLLNGCDSLNKLPEEVGHIENLEILDISSSGVWQLPVAERLRNIQKLVCKGCKSFTPPSFSGFESLTKLDLSLCCLTTIPESISLCSSLKTLHVFENDFEFLPESIKNLTNLEKLSITECKSLVELPKLPPSIREVLAFGCESLKTIHSPIVCIDARKLWFAGCPKLDGNEEINNLMGCKFLLSQIKNDKSQSRLYTSPGSKIPKWINDQNLGDSVTMHLPKLDLNVDSNLLGFTFSAIIATERATCNYFVNLEIGEKIFSIGDVCQLSSNSENLIIVFYPIELFTVSGFQMGGTMEVCFKRAGLPTGSFDEIDISLMPALEVKECGVCLIYKEMFNILMGV